MKLLPALLFLLLSFAASGQVTVLRGTSVIMETNNVQIKDSTAYKTGGYWQNRGLGFGRWAFPLDSSYQRNDTLFIRQGTIGTKSYKLGGSGTATDTTSLSARINTKLDTAISGGDNNLVVTANQLATRKGFNVVADAATIAVNAALGMNHVTTLGGTRTLSVSNMQQGQYLTLVVYQDATGGRELNLPAGWYVISTGTAGKAPIATTPNLPSVIVILYTGSIYLVAGGAFKL